MFVTHNLFSGGEASAKLTLSRRTRAFLMITLFRAMTMRRTTTALGTAITVVTLSLIGRVVAANATAGVVVNAKAGGRSLLAPTEITTVTMALIVPKIGHAVAWSFPLTRQGVGSAMAGGVGSVLQLWAMLLLRGSVASAVWRIQEAKDVVVDV